MCGSPKENITSSLHALLVLLGWFVRWEVTLHIAAVLLGTRFFYLGSSHKTFSLRFIRVQLALPYISTDMATAWNNPRFISLESLDFFNTGEK